MAESETMGVDASGAALLSLDGDVSIFKRRAPASELVSAKGFKRLLSGWDSDVLAALGHRRRETVGTSGNPRNIHPVVAGPVVRTHNGTITNADRLFWLKDLARTAQVDSEIIFRIAANVIIEGEMYIPRLKRSLKCLKGNMTAIFASSASPGKIYAAKADMPLSFRYNPDLDVYASTCKILGWALEDSLGEWEAFRLPRMTLAVFDASGLKTVSNHPLNFHERS